ncbi:carbohydrate kinase [Synechococcus sp. PCC 6312]|uniref:carbohydrate kinase family protein n=1 Tax=Synechococcus sp. (strain ATCC 27167 / PCC 6312) TaxID=195253 RepID=UPI0009FE7916|nr:carbohydrate kinase [Synechococcus sp. PCC 6312]
MLPSVLCFGEVLEDCITKDNQRHCYLGGAPANVAAGLVKLGTPAGFIGAVGKDAIGDRIVEQLQGLGVNLTGIQRVNQAPTRQVLVQHQANGDREFVGFAPADSPFFADEQLQAKALPKSLIESAQFLVLGTLGFATATTGQALGRVLELAHLQQIKVLIDVNWRPIFWKDPDLAKSLILELLPQAQVIKLAAEEAAWLFQTTEPARIKDQVQGHIGLVVVTDGERGCQFSTGIISGELPAFRVKVTDTTGAGDGFVAGLLHCLCPVKELQNAFTNATFLTQSLQFASAVGAMVTQGAGATAPQPTASEVQRFLDRL